MKLSSILEAQIKEDTTAGVFTFNPSTGGFDGSGDIAPFAHRMPFGGTLDMRSSVGKGSKKKKPVTVLGFKNFEPWETEKK